MEDKMLKSKYYITINFITILILILLIPQNITQFQQDIFSPIVESDLSYFSDLSGSSDEYIIEEKLNHKISLLIKNKGTHQILGNNFNILPKYVTINEEKSDLISKDIYTTEVYSYVTLE